MFRKIIVTRLLFWEKSSVSSRLEDYFWSILLDTDDALSSYTVGMVVVSSISVSSIVIS